MRLISILALCCLAFGFMGCDDEQNPRVSGSLEIEMADMTTGFEFPGSIELLTADEVADQEEGERSLLGSCAVTADGRVSAIEFSIRRLPADQQNIGLDAFSGSWTEEATTLDAEVVRNDGSRVELSYSGMSDCIAESWTINTDDGAATLDIDCELSSQTAGTARAVGTLEFDRCTLVEP